MTTTLPAAATPDLHAVTDWLMVLDRIRTAVDKAYGEFGIVSDTIVRQATVNPIGIRNAVICSVYHAQRSAGIPSPDVIDSLAEQHGLTFMTVREIVRRRR